MSTQYLNALLANRNAQTTFTAEFILADMSREDLAEWSDILDRFARLGTLPLNNIGTVKARKFAALGLIKFFRGEMWLTPLGEQADYTHPAA